jgi:hypothetical protein
VHKGTTVISLNSDITRIDSIAEGESQYQYSLGVGVSGTYRRSMSENGKARRCGQVS